MICYDMRKYDQRGQRFMLLSCKARAHINKQTKIYIYIYIHTHKESLSLCIYIYIYIYTSSVCSQTSVVQKSVE